MQAGHISAVAKRSRGEIVAMFGGRFRRRIARATNFRTGGRRDTRVPSIAYALRRSASRGQRKARNHDSYLLDLLDLLDLRTNAISVPVLLLARVATSSLGSQPRRHVTTSKVNRGNFTPRYDASQINVRSDGSRFENSQLNIIYAHT